MLITDKQDKTFAGSIQIPATSCSSSINEKELISNIFRKIDFYSSDLQNSNKKKLIHAIIEYKKTERITFKELKHKLSELETVDQKDIDTLVPLIKEAKEKFEKKELWRMSREGERKQKETERKLQETERKLQEAEIKLQETSKQLDDWKKGNGQQIQADTNNEQSNQRMAQLEREIKDTKEAMVELKQQQAFGIETFAALHRNLAISIVANTILVPAVNYGLTSGFQYLGLLPAGKVGIISGSIQQIVVKYFPNQSGLIIANNLVPFNKAFCPTLQATPIGIALWEVCNKVLGTSYSLVNNMFLSKEEIKKIIETESEKKNAAKQKAAIEAPETAHQLEVPPVEPKTQVESNLSQLLNTQSVSSQTLPEQPAGFSLEDACPIAPEAISQEPSFLPTSTLPNREMPPTLETPMVTPPYNSSNIETTEDLNSSNNSLDHRFVIFDPLLDDFVEIEVGVKKN